MAKNRVIVAFQIEESFKNELSQYCADNDIVLSQLIRKALKEFAKREGIGGKK